VAICATQLKLLAPATQLKSTILPALADVNIATEKTVAAPMRAIDHEAEDHSARRLFNTALSLRAFTDWIQSAPLWFRAARDFSGAESRFWYTREASVEREQA
jgi:hypothetical protein